MSVLEIICGVVLLLSAVVVIYLTLVQEPKGRGLSGAIMGGDAAQVSAGRSRSSDARIAKVTKIVGIVFCVCALLISIISVRMG